ncbi:hypothetical protein MJ579_06275 [Klebsiella pneumoniae]|nr:hypothetical protein MJ579_06275 [Klebsiella pneumoniae]
MLSLGGVIGTGLFFNTGYIISTTSAAGTLLAYLIGALVVWLVMRCSSGYGGDAQDRRLPRCGAPFSLLATAIPWRWLCS